MNEEFRKLPSVDQLLAHNVISQLLASYPHAFITNLVRKQLDETRKSITAGGRCPAVEEIARAVADRLQNYTTTSLLPVINATGVVLHTNLGRAPLSREAIEAMSMISAGFSNLEFDLESGARGSRQAHIEKLLCEVTGAEAGLVVNNNAAAVLLGLSAHARRKEIIVSRGQAVEIGDSFRIPDVMRQSGAKLVEVGTTNCTYTKDYEQAITQSTAAFLRVHSSNFKVIGFTSEVTIEELVASANGNGLPVFDDLGSGCFLDTAQFGLAAEPMVQRSVAAGASLIFFSGDKLVGGPQAGIIVGRRQYVDKLRRHPLARAVRIDKIRLAGLIATLIHYVRGEATSKIPIWRMISTPVEEIEKRALVYAETTGGLGKVVSGESMVGGGSLPGSTLPTKMVVIGKGEKKTSSSIMKINRELRQWKTPIIGRIQDNNLVLDPRTVLVEDDPVVCSALKVLCSKT
jgi:L-seryl-tRNA(Ser) seleniumtransferase